MEQHPQSASGVEVTLSKRLSLLPPYLFVEIDRKKREAQARGVDLINLGIGDPDIPTPPSIVEALKVAAEKPVNHRYPETEGLPAFRQACARWYRNRFGVILDSDKEVLTLIGAKEGIGHLPLALIEPGEVVLMPDPAYPVYYSGTVFACGEPYFMPLLKENGFLPDLKAIPQDVARRAKLMFINYPNNPTGAVAPLEFYQDVVEFAQQHNIVVCSDNTYSEIRFDGYRPVSMLQVPGAKEVGIEIHSLSKTFSMTGWRIGCAVGHPKVVEGLCAIKSNLDSGAFQAVQEAGITALEHAEEVATAHSAVYQERRDVLIEALRGIGIEVEPPKASFYVWAPVPKGHTSASFVDMLLDKAGIVCTPGRGFGVYGEGYVRIALTADVSRLREAADRIARLRL
ncbi:MAG: LL-diaminopimelate aminotransferase [Bacteroidetes bacterium]|nr:LL-diaminopimelate aminotransferase [Bacteroidota bacterium]MCL5027256.1 LL-diaminopimelate aminotransferase [Chloroflexota bacterium]